MKSYYSVFSFMLFFVLSVFNPVFSADNRIALVVGNGVYKAAPLTTPGNDADLMERALKKLGFKVRKEVNVSQKKLKRLIQDFGDSLNKPDTVALFYYSGHGMQVEGQNYMIPVGANIGRESDVDIESVKVNSVLSTMAYSRSKINIVILDACRDNPYARNFKFMTKGLVSMDAEVGTLIAYATSPGDVARAGDGRYSPYTEALAEKIQMPGVSIEKAFKEVRKAVKQNTRDQQIPWESSSLTEDFYFNPAAKSSSSNIALQDAIKTQRQLRKPLTPLTKLKPASHATISQLPWVKHFTTSKDEKFILGKQTSDNGYLIYSVSSNSRAPFYRSSWLSKIDSSGNLAWQLSLDKHKLGAIVALDEVNSGEIFVAASDRDLRDRVWLLKLSASGQMLWDPVLVNQNKERVYDMVAMNNGWVIVAGKLENEAGVFSSANFTYDGWVRAYSRSGDLLWQKEMGDNGTHDDDEFIAIKPLAFNKYALLGNTISYGAGGYDVWVVIIDSLGNIISTKTYGTKGFDRAISLDYNINGTLTVLARRQIDLGRDAYWVFNVNVDSGSKNWERFLEVKGVTYETAFITSTADGGSIIAGDKGLGDSWLLKLDARGGSQWEIDRKDGDRWVFDIIPISSKNQYMVLGGFKDSTRSGALAFILDEKGNQITN